MSLILLKLLGYVFFLSIVAAFINHVLIDQEHLSDLKKIFLGAIAMSLLFIALTIIPIAHSNNFTSLSLGELLAIQAGVIGFVAVTFK